MTASVAHSEMRKKAREDKFYRKALGLAPKGKRRQANAPKAAAVQKPSTAHIDSAELIAAITALTIHISKLEQTMRELDTPRAIRAERMFRKYGKL